MNDSEKLSKLIDYIRDAERYHLDNACKGIVESGYKACAIQDILVYMEHELDIEYIQLPSKEDISQEDYT